MIWDKTHKAALAYLKGEERIFELNSFTPPPPDEAEVQMRQLFCRFFETIVIDPRENPRCQMTHLPKRYRGQMTEFMSPEAAGACEIEKQAKSGGLFLNRRL